MNFEQSHNAEQVPQESSVESAEKFEEYILCLKEYVRLYDTVKLRLMAVERARDETAYDNARHEMMSVDRQRHRVHLTLIELAVANGKNEYDVKTDILREGGTLEEYELPEFSILTHQDFLNSEVFSEAELEVWESHYSDQQYEKEYVGESEVMIVFLVEPRSKYTDVENIDLMLDACPDRDCKMRRARSLAELCGGRIVDAENGIYHDDLTQGVMGVAVEKADLEKVVQRIKDDNLRVGMEFYSEEERAEISANLCARVIEYVSRGFRTKLYADAAVAPGEAGMHEFLATIHSQLDNGEIAPKLDAFLAETERKLTELHKDAGRLSESEWKNIYVMIENELRNAEGWEYAITLFQNF